eukprot:5280395-Pyramimonas_sp.AAC.1
MFLKAHWLQNIYGYQPPAILKHITKNERLGFENLQYVGKTHPVPAPAFGDRPLVLGLSSSCDVECVVSQVYSSMLLACQASPRFVGGSRECAGHICISGEC